MQMGEQDNTQAPGVKGDFCTQPQEIINSILLATPPLMKGFYAIPGAYGFKISVGRATVSILWDIDNGGFVSVTRDDCGDLSLNATIRPRDRHRDTIETAQAELLGIAAQIIKMVEVAK